MLCSFFRFFGARSGANGHKYTSDVIDIGDPSDPTFPDCGRIVGKLESPAAFRVGVDADGLGIVDPTNPGEQSLIT